MKTIIAGSRTLGRLDLAAAAEQVPWTMTEVICGCAPGIDQEGEFWARCACVPVSFWPAWAYQFAWAQKAARPGEGLHWSPFMYRDDSTAGFRRNRKMAENAEALLAVWDGKSRGTQNMIQEAKRRGLKVFVWSPERKKAA